MTSHTPRERSGLALLVIAAAQLLMVMDGTIVTVGLPVIGAGLDIPEADLDWVLTSYALAFGGLLLAGGRAGDLFGRRRMFRAGLVVFLAASLLGGVAGDGTVLIAARVLQGVGAAIVAPAALSLLADTFPAGPGRNRALGVYGAMGGLGSVTGLLLGGALTEYLGWRWIMFVNVPIALLVLAGTVVLRPGTRERGGLDLPGAVTVTLALGSLVYAINRAGSHGAGDALTLAFGAAALALLGAFVLIQRSARSPMLPPAVMADRGRLGANLVMLLMGAGQLATFYFLTLYMQTINQYSPMITGLAYLPFAVGIGIGSGLVGPRLQARTSTRIVLVAGMAVAAVAMGWFSLLAPGQNPWSSSCPPSSPAASAWGSASSAPPSAACRASRRVTPGSPPAWSTPASRSAVPSAWPYWRAWPPPPPRAGLRARPSRTRSPAATPRACSARAASTWPRSSPPSSCIGHPATFTIYQMPAPHEAPEPAS
ncbi:MFS transporter [Nonomuraea rubra]|uniref:MFS transporter n=1 Tax=Nonomuraea rubra TaxID=46180 RepID=UPI0036133D02